MNEKKKKTKIYKPFPKVKTEKEIELKATQFQYNGIYTQRIQKSTKYISFNTILLCVKANAEISQYSSDCSAKHNIIIISSQHTRC